MDSMDSMDRFDGLPWQIPGSWAPAGRPEAFQHLPGAAIGTLLSFSDSPELEELVN